jgi:hypothetical protein
VNSAGTEAGPTLGNYQDCWGVKSFFTTEDTEAQRNYSISN